MEHVRILVSCMATLEDYVYRLYITLSNKTSSPYNVIFKHIAEVSRGHREILEELFGVKCLDFDDIKKYKEFVGSLFIESLTKIKELITYIDEVKDIINKSELKGIVGSLVTVESSASEEYLTTLFSSIIDLNIKEKYLWPESEAHLIASLMRVISDEEKIHTKILNLMFDSL